jgi:hypothetical protein
MRFEAMDMIATTWCGHGMSFYVVTVIAYFIGASLNMADTDVVKSNTTLWRSMRMHIAYDIT